MSLSSPDDSTAVQDQLHDVQQTFPANREKQLAIPGFAVSCRFPRSPVVIALLHRVRLLKTEYLEEGYHSY